MPKFKRVSADEAQAVAKAKRKDLVRDTSGGTSILKAAKAPASWNDTQRSARFVMTTEQVDRYGDIVVTAGGDLTEFNRNPVGLLFHNSRTWPVARWANIEVLSRTRPPRMEGDFVVLPSGGPVKEVDQAAWMIANGGITACSIGFNPNWDEVEMILDEEQEWFTGFKFNAWELLECSVCPIPANAGALVKSAQGDFNMAQELLEDVLDNWVKTPEGLLLSRSDFEATHKGISNARSIHFVDRNLAAGTKAFVGREDAEIKATNDVEAAEFIGAKVVFDPAHPENKGWPFDVLAKASGEVIASFIVDNGPNKGVHGLWVEYLEVDYSGMFRGIKAERFLLVPKSEDKPVEEPCDTTGDDTVKDPCDDPPDMDDPEMDETSESEKSLKTALKIDVDASGILEATKNIEALGETVTRTEKRVESLFERIRKLFPGKVATTEKIEPKLIDPPLELRAPTEDEVTKIKGRAAAMRQRLIEKGMIAAE